MKKKLTQSLAFLSNTAQLIRAHNEALLALTSLGRGIADRIIHPTRTLVPNFIGHNQHLRLASLQTMQKFILANANRSIASRPCDPVRIILTILVIIALQFDQLVGQDNGNQKEDSQN
jgi:hypothetical protein